MLTLYSSFDEAYFGIGSISFSVFISHKKYKREKNKRKTGFFSYRFFISFSQEQLLVHYWCNFLLAHVESRSMLMAWLRLPEQEKLARCLHTVLVPRTHKSNSISSWRKTTFSSLCRDLQPDLNRTSNCLNIIDLLSRSKQFPC